MLNVFTRVDSQFCLRLELGGKRRLRTKPGWINIDLTEIRLDLTFMYDKCSGIAAFTRYIFVDRNSLPNHLFTDES